MNQVSNLQHDNEEPLYNIGVVSRMTNIAEPTLRIWERRYDFPESSRTAGGHRLYSQREILRLQWVKNRVDEGMQISRAIKALHHAEKTGQSFDTSSSFHKQSTTTSDIPDTTLNTFHSRLFKILIEHNTDLADQILAEALSVYSIEQILDKLIAPILHDIGQGWAEGQIDVATEHLATNYLRHKLLLWMRGGPPAYATQPVMLACAPGELHEGSLLMMGVLLRRLRWNVVYLGQTIEWQGFSTFVNQVRPAILVFVAMTEHSAQSLSEWHEWLPDVHKTKRPLVSFGGRIFVEQPEWIDHVEGIYLGQTLQEGISNLDHLLRNLNPLVK